MDDEFSASANSLLLTQCIGCTCPRNDQWASTSEAGRDITGDQASVYNQLGLGYFTFHPL